MSQRPLQDPTKVWLWGIHACQSALSNPKRKCLRFLATRSTFKDFTFDNKDLSIKPEILEAGTLSRILPAGAVHQGIALETTPLIESSLSILSTVEKGVVIVLDQVTDPHNVGAMIRTAKALGGLGVILTDRNAPPLSGVLAKAASGALDLIPIWKVTNLARTLDDLKGMGFWTVGLDEHAKKYLLKSELPEKIALVMGAEGEGMRRLTQDKCDFLTKLRTDPNFSTLNVSVANAIALYELTQSAEASL